MKIHTAVTQITQQDYYGWGCNTLLHSYYTGTYTEITVLIFWGSFTVSMEYLHSYTDEIPTWGNSGTKSKEQHCYFCVGTSVVAVQ